MFSTIKQHIQPRHFALLAMCGLAFIYMALFRYDNYGIEEGAARALLINWSIIDQIANATPLFGMPDLRAIMFIFLDLHWAGSLPAAKVFTLFMLFATVLMLYRWAEAYDNAETATMSTALLLIAPITIMQVDSISPGVFLLFCFASAFWLEDMFKRAKRHLAGSVFMLILFSVFAVSLHPMGLALPAALLFLWLSNKPSDAPDPIESSEAGIQSTHEQKRRTLLIGLAISTLLISLLRWGWNGLESGQAHLATLGAIFAGSPILQTSPPTGFGLIVASLLGFVIAMYAYRRYFDLLGLTLSFACIIGIFHADASWALLALATTLYLGFPLLIAAHRRTGIQNLIGQRGLVIVLIVVLTSIFTAADKKQRIINHAKLKTDTDYLITSAERIAHEHQDNFLIASQWPARTMLATRRDVLPLPPKRILDNADTFSDNTKGITHYIFNPNDENNRQLSQIAASLGGHRMEAIELLPAGVILQVNEE